jgi:2-keto-3-deoxy-L-rhamnonate aldolase RhmA
MRTNYTKDKLRRGETVFGCALQHLRSAEVARIFGAAGFDYIFIDGEHTSFDLETVHDVINASVRAGITPLVRVGELLYSLVSRALDIGAQGIIFPRVEDPEVLAEAISWTRFPPEGKRGFGMMAPVLDYEQCNFEQIIAHHNASTMTVVQFETQTAIDRCDELLDVPGIDVVMVGPSDLSISLGVAGQFDHLRLLDAVGSLIQSCERRGIAPGIQCRNVKQAMAWEQRGMKLIGIGSEHTLLLERAKDVVSTMRQSAHKGIAVT